MNLKHQIGLVLDLDISNIKYFDIKSKKVGKQKSHWDTYIIIIMNVYFHTATEKSLKHNIRHGSASI